MKVYEQKKTDGGNSLSQDIKEQKFISEDKGNSKNKDKYYVVYMQKSENENNNEKEIKNSNEEIENKKNKNHNRKNKNKERNEKISSTFNTHLISNEDKVENKQAKSPKAKSPKHPHGRVQLVKEYTVKN